MSHVRVPVLFDRYKLGVWREKYAWMEPRFITPQTRGQRKVPGLVVHPSHRYHARSVPVDRSLVAEELHLVTRIVPVQPDTDTRRRVAMSAGVDQSHIRQREVEGNGVDALAVVAIWAVPGTGASRRKLWPRANFRVASDLRLIWGVESWRDIVLASVSLGLKVDSVQVDV